MCIGLSRVGGSRGSKAIPADLFDVEASSHPTSLDRDRLRRADPRHLVLVYRPHIVHACSAQRHKGPRTGTIFPVSEDSSVSFVLPGIVALDCSRNPNNPDSPYPRWRRRLLPRDQGLCLRMLAALMSSSPPLHACSTLLTWTSIAKWPAATERQSCKWAHFPGRHGAAWLVWIPFMKYISSQNLHSIESARLLSHRDRGRSCLACFTPTERSGAIASLVRSSSAIALILELRTKRRAVWLRARWDWSPRSISPTTRYCCRDLYLRCLHRGHDDSAPPGENRGAHYGGAAALRRDKEERKFGSALRLLALLLGVLWIVVADDCVRPAPYRCAPDCS